VLFGYPPWASSVDDLVARLVETVEDVLAATGAGKVHLVGHSPGGVIIALALTRDGLSLARRPGGHARISVQRSPWAGMVPLGPLLRALRPGSPILRRLAAAAAPAGVRWLAFASSSDVTTWGSPALRSLPFSTDSGGPVSYCMSA
jgi:alpha-beta hydrolase superfamily lysophospholipase